MYRSLMHHLQWRNDLLLSGRYQELSQLYLLPQALYLSGNPWVLRNTADTVAAMACLHQMLRDRQILSRTPVIKAVELPRQGRFRAWVRWDEGSAEPAQSRTSEMVYYFRETPDGPRTEMVEFTSLCLPEFRQVVRTARRA